MKRKILSLICISAIGAACLVSGCQSSQSDVKPEENGKNVPIVQTRENGDGEQSPECPECPDHPQCPQDPDCNKPFPFKHHSIFRRRHGHDAPAPNPGNDPLPETAPDARQSDRATESEQGKTPSENDGQHRRRGHGKRRKAAKRQAVKRAKPLPKTEKAEQPAPQTEDNARENGGENAKS